MKLKIKIEIIVFKFDFLIFIMSLYSLIHLLTQISTSKLHN